ncbi:hypothetical protein BDV98DRAFT_572929 [Pterulicium gracile]|uniref:Uncharacterized protein n=1 Tax=Pterulicium gracile TaxID=1884261 RepID=A0A5C3QCV8_9AGAR|nr:hypothetical protein BDV98DRAFT_572929 [Pterula gracilis]
MFKFRYTSRDILMARGIIDRDSSPAPPSTNTAAVNAESDALRNEIIKLEGERAPSVQVKRERQEDVVDLTEPVLTKRKRVKVTPTDNEIIDLTLD